MSVAHLKLIREVYANAASNAHTSKANYLQLLDAFEQMWQAASVSAIAELDYRKNLVGGGLGWGKPPGSMCDRIELARQYVAQTDYLPPAAGEALADNLLALFGQRPAHCSEAVAPLIAAVAATVEAGNL
ncbi:hypothetical protein [Burkholderia sp. 22313]|uniref:hypothetical protein n=1 Tax=Burkholderia sp. 22313 TaxID=3453908 RepID=UPI003F850C4A